MALIDKAAPFIKEKFPGGGIAVTSLDWALNWARESSLWYLLFGIACCAIEMMATGASHFDLDRFGIFHRGTPRQSDLMIVAGTVNTKMAERLRRLYDQMAEPKWVIAMGSCACTGGPYYDAYTNVRGVDRVVPVDVYIPGCPPRPEALLDGLMKLQTKIRGMSLVDASSPEGGEKENNAHGKTA